MILADTSVWVDPFRRSDAALYRQLQRNNISIHPSIHRRRVGSWQLARPEEDDCLSRSATHGQSRPDERGTAHDRSPLIVSSWHRFCGCTSPCLYPHYAAHCSLVARQASPRNCEDAWTRRTCFVRGPDDFQVGALAAPGLNSTEQHRTDPDAVRATFDPDSKVHIGQTHPSSATGSARNPFGSGKPFGARATTAALTTRDLPTTLRTKSRFTVSPMSGSSVHFAS